MSGDESSSSLLRRSGHPARPPGAHDPALKDAVRQARLRAQGRWWRFTRLLLPLAVATAVAAAALPAWWLLRREADRQGDARFTSRADAAAVAFRDRLVAHEVALRLTAAVFTGGRVVSPETWDEWVASVRANPRFAGIHAVAWIARVEPDARAGFLAARRRDHPGFAIRPENDGEQWVVAMAAPSPAIGLLGEDLHASDARRVVAEAAAREAAIGVTGPLPAEAGLGDGLHLLLAPVWWDVAPPADPAARMQRLRGWVGLRFSPTETLAAIARQHPDLQLSLRDGEGIDDVGEENRHLLRPIAFAGRTWLLRAVEAGAGRSWLERHGEGVVLVASLAVAVLLAGLAATLHGGRRRALQLVEMRTAELETMRQRLEAAVSASGDGAYDIDFVAGRAWYSPRYLAMLGLAPGDLPEDEPLAWRRLIHPDDLPAIDRMVGLHLTEGVPLEVEGRVRCKNGSWLWILARSQAIADADGRLQRLSGIVTDITARRRAEEVLAASQRRFRELVEGLAEVVFSVDRDGRWTFLGPAWSELTGRPVEQHLGRSWLEAVHEEDRALAVSALRDLIDRRADVRRVAIRVVTSSGGVRWADVHARPAFAEDGTVLGISGTIADVTERRLAEEALHRERAFVREVVDAAPSPIAVRDRGGAYRLVNRAYAALHGAEPEPLLARLSASPPPLSPSDQAALAGEQTVIEERVIDHEGVERWFRTTKRPLCREDGRVDLMSISIDITARRRQEDELRRARDAAESANRAKSEFLAMMSHEIRTPMVGVLGMLEMMVGDDVPASVREQASVALAGARSLMALIDDILDFSKIEAGRLELERAEFALDEVIDEVVALGAPRAREKGLRLVASIAPEVPMRVLGDRHRLRQVLLNLVGNALKFTASGRVALRVARDDGGRVRIAVADTGIGIPPDALERLFTRFTQADSSTTRRFGGSGLGLAISRLLVEAMGGGISVTSTVGQGSEFVVAVPLPAAPGSAGGGWGAGSTTVEVAVADPVQAEAVLAMARRLGLQPVATGAVLVIGDADAAQRPPLPAHAIALVDELDACQPGWVRCVLPLRSSALRAALRASFGAAVPVAVDETPALRLAGRVLLVEDHPINQRVVSAFLHRLGLESEVARDGLDGLHRLAAGRFDLVLMDCHMPGMDGFAATRALRERERGGGRRTPVLALTADLSPEARAQCAAAGMDGFVAKPCELGTLADAMRPWLAAEAPPASAPATTPGPVTTSPAARPADATSPVDLPVIARLRQAVGPALDEIIAAFVRESAPRVEEMRRAAVAGDMAELRRLAHRHRGCSLNLGCTVVGLLCGRLEQAAQAAPADLTGLIDELDRASVATCRALQ